MVAIESRKRIAIAIIFLLMGMMIGFYMGSYVTIKSVVSIGSGFIDKELVKQAIYNYDYKIKECFPNEMDSLRGLDMSDDN